MEMFLNLLLITAPICEYTNSSNCILGILYDVEYASAGKAKLTCATSFPSGTILAWTLKAKLCSRNSGPIVQSQRAELMTRLTLS